MKTRLWKRVKEAAKYRAHITAMNCITNGFGRVVSMSASIGYGYADMTEDEFDRAVISKYWELHKDEYYAKYRRRKKGNSLGG